MHRLLTEQMKPPNNGGLTDEDIVICRRVFDKKKPLPKNYEEAWKDKRDRIRGENILLVGTWRQLELLNPQRFSHESDWALLRGVSDMVAHDGASDETQAALE